MGNVEDISLTRHTFQRQKLFDNFLRPDFTNRDRHSAKDAHLYTPDFQLHMPFMPKGMQRVFDPGFAESTKEWMARTVVKWDQVSFACPERTGCAWICASSKTC